MTDNSEPHLITSPMSLAAAHGPGVVVTQGSHGPYSFLADGATFTKYHQQPSFLNTSGKVSSHPPTPPSSHSPTSFLSAH